MTEDINDWIEKRRKGSDLMCKLLNKNKELEKENKICEEIIIGEQQEINDLQKENAELKAKLEESEVFIENIVKASADNPNEFFELRKENAELKEHIKEVENDITICEICSYETINKLKAQIEKMKNFYNCAHSNRALCPNKHNCKGCKDWEIAE